MIRIYSDYNALLRKEIKYNKGIHSYHIGKESQSHFEDINMSTMVVN